MKCRKIKRGQEKTRSKLVLPKKRIMTIAEKKKSRLPTLASGMQGVKSISFILIATILLLFYVFHTNLFESCSLIKFPKNSSNVPFDFDEFKGRIRLLPTDNGTEHTVRPAPASQWKERRFQPQGSHSFIQYSAYRISPSCIFVLGIGDSIFRHNHTVGPCTWHGMDGNVIQGKLFYVHDGERPYQYSIILLRCDLEQVTGNGGGHLISEMDGQQDVVFVENANMVQGKVDDDNDFEFNHTYCTAPLHGRLHAKMMWQWMEYHRVLFDADNFVIYHVDYDMSEFMPYIQSYVDRGSVDIVDFSDILAFKIWYFGQTLAAWDCTYRYALKSRWIYLHDMDEYLQVHPPHTLPSILRKHKDASWITHGMVAWNVKMCSKHSPPFTVESGRKGDAVRMDYGEEFAIERMIYKSKDIYCLAQDSSPDMCLYWIGHRKLIINPRKVTWAQVHVAVNYEGEGVDLNAKTVMIHNHYRGIHSFKNDSFCTKLYSDGEVREKEKEKEWVQEKEMASLGQIIRSCLKNPSNCSV